MEFANVYFSMVPSYSSLRRMRWGRGEGQVRRERGREKEQGNVHKRECNQRRLREPMKTLLGPDINILSLSARHCSLLQEPWFRNSQASVINLRT